MSNPRQPKWDWPSHLPQMEELYKSGMSIPRIHEAIQCEGFTPSQRAVYLKFRNEGFPTDHAERTRFLQARFASNVQDFGNVASDTLPDAPSSVQHRVHRTQDHDTQNILGISDSVLLNNPEQLRFFSGQTSPDLLKTELYNTTESIVVGTDEGLPPHIKVDLNKDQALGGSTIFTSTVCMTNPVSKICSWFKQKSCPSQPPVKRLSDSSGDSGYYGDQALASTPPLGTSSPHPKSLTEFQGLYRVACHSLHEPQPMDQYRAVRTCNHCNYSNIHNLAWSARYMKLETFQKELNLQEVHNFERIDAVGNSALHYAAASGASYRHLKALFDAGVNPYQVNTAGQLFIHWLRPYIANSDCFNLDLLKLLKLLQPNRAFGRQDNNGQTVLHALALHITQPGLGAQIFRAFIDAGFPPTVLDRFGRTATDVVPLSYTPGDMGTDLSMFNTTPVVDEYANSMQSPVSEASDMSEWGLQILKQINAQDILAEAYINSHHVNPSTGDTVIHALSRVSPRNNEILQNLQYFVVRGVDLNRHNLYGDHPLALFTGDRASEENETGATLAKYLDALLWKDPRHRVGNEINVNMKNREGATALYNAAIRGRPDSVRSLIEAGANVNARLDTNGNQLSILQATLNARVAAVVNNDRVQMHLLKEVISHLEHAGAVQDPTSLQERGFGCESSPRDLQPPENYPSKRAKNATQEISALTAVRFVK